MRILKKNLVFPTRVGMVLRIQFESNYPVCFPHTRGDGPLLEKTITIHDTFSPHAWGWSVMENHPRFALTLS